jgi:hypothetical protein
MCLRRLKTAARVLLSCVALAGSGVLLWPALATEEAQSPTTEARARVRVSPAELAKLHALIRPHPDEARCRWMTDIPWQTSLWEARWKAAEQGKPLLVVGSGGGSPLGRC